jgi:hypothetical protein
VWHGSLSISLCLSFCATCDDVYQFSLSIVNHPAAAHARMLLIMNEGMHTLLERMKA